MPPDADLQIAGVTLKEKLTPAGLDAAMEELTRLWVTTRTPSISDQQKELMLGAYEEELAAYPLDIIKAACRNPPRWKFWPELGPLLDRADALLAEWQMVADALTPQAVERARKRKAALAETAAAAAQRREEILAYEAERKRGWDEAAKWRAANPGPYREAVRTYSSVADDPVTGEPKLTTSAAMKRVKEELAVTGFRLKGVDDPGVQARLREMGVDPAEAKFAPATGSVGAKGSDRRGPTWPRVPRPPRRRAKKPVKRGGRR